MILVLILGVALWCAAHAFKRVAPGIRAPLGERGKGLVAIVLLASVVLMVIGYRNSSGAVFWGRTPALTGINNLLMVLAFYAFSTGSTPPGRPRNWLGTKVRHPQLTGFAIWAVAHLLVNGDVESFILFGGLLVWSLAEIVLINRAEPDWTPPEYGGMKTEVRIAGIGLVILIVVMLIHNWIGVTPWG